LSNGICTLEAAEETSRQKEYSGNIQLFAQADGPDLSSLQNVYDLSPALGIASAILTAQYPPPHIEKEKNRDRTAHATSDEEGNEDFFVDAEETIAANATIDAADATEPTASTIDPDPDPDPKPPPLVTSTANKRCPTVTSPVSGSTPALPSTSTLPLASLSRWRRSNQIRQMKVNEQRDWCRITNKREGKEANV
jgi:hypothetical protein